MDRASGAPALRVAVAWSAREGEACEIGVELPGGASVLDAIRASGALEAGGTVDISTQAVGIWGRAARLDTRLAEGDRVEIYRPLLLDPKEARRLRARRRK
ncbi:MAG: RnfH family protein [Burkholderiales bacterium]|nr:RnfH family protein [Burkholderiales bacterium]